MGGLTFDGHHVWFASGDRLNALDPASGKIERSIRARIEQAVGKPKRLKRIALRCEKTKRNFASIVTLVASYILIKSVHTT